MQTSELNNLMQASAQDAVAFANEQHQIHLDFSVSSLARVDNLLSHLHAEHQTKAYSSEMLFTICNIVGAYIGEVFIANVGGQWQSNVSDETAPYMAVGFGDKEFPFASVCYHKITNADSISLQDYVQQAKHNAMQ